MKIRSQDDIGQNFEHHFSFITCEYAYGSDQLNIDKSMAYTAINQAIYSTNRPPETRGNAKFVRFDLGRLLQQVGRDKAVIAVPGDIVRASDEDAGNALLIPAYNCLFYPG
jgi:hypothetical protein